MIKIKTLVIYYSRTGSTKKIAENIVNKIKSDIEEIIDLKKRKGKWGFLIAGKDATLRKMTKIKAVEKDPSNYDLIIIGTPVWNGKMASAIRTYLKEFKEKIKEVAFFSTAKGDFRGVFEDLQEVIEKEPKATLKVLEKEIENQEIEDKIKEFINNLTN